MKGKFLSFFLVSFLYLLVSCETSPPLLPDQTIESGKVFVYSNVDSAKIYLDDIFTSQYTPDTITASTGEHKISLIKEGFVFEEKMINVEKNSISDIIIISESKQIKKIVLLEDFANVSCDPCVVSNSIINSLSNSYGDQIVIIKYSTNFPSPTDPFYFSAPALNNERAAFYNILFVPTIIIDGIEKPVSTDKDAIQTEINKRITASTPFDLMISDSLTTDNYFVHIETKLLDKSLDYTNCKLFAAVVEKEITFDNPPGSNGETKFYHVMRSFDTYDIANVITETNPILNHNFSFQIKNDWNTENISAIAFIQDSKTSEIYQAYSTEFNK